MRGKHALLLVENLPVPFDRRVWAEAQALRRDGWLVSVVGPGFSGGRWHEHVDGVEIYRFPFAATGAGLAGHLLEYAVAVPALSILAALAHLRRRVDVIHAANPPDFFFPLARAFHQLGAAFIFDQHDPSPELYRAQGGRQGGLIDRFLVWCERESFHAADVVIATNESIARLARGRGGVDARRVVVVRSSVDTARTYRVEPDQLLKKGRQFLVVYVGVMGPQDGVDLFVHASRRIADLLPGAVQFMAIGDGSERGSARRLAKRLGMGEDIHFPGRLTDAQLRTALSTADLAIGPDPANGFNELCTMNKTMEYMAMGVPSVCFDLAETRETAGEAALYARPNDPLDLARCAVEILTSNDRGVALASVGRARMEGELRWERSVAALRRAYDLALATAHEMRR